MSIKRKLRIKKVNRKSLVDFAGMNKIAARKLGYRMPRNTDIVIVKGLSRKQTGRTIGHEKYEMNQMIKGDNYFTAHKKADRKYPSAESNIRHTGRTGTGRAR